MSLNGKDDGDYAVKEGPLDQHPQDIPEATKPYRERKLPDQDEQIARAVSEVPDDLSVADTLDWVGGDKRRAQKALDAENKGGGARTTLVHELERVLKDETGAGVVSGEA
jgi:hypothetical protein